MSVQCRHILRPSAQPARTTILVLADRLVLSNGRAISMVVVCLSVYPFVVCHGCIVAKR